jgi:D-aspartate ligase
MTNTVMPVLILRSEHYGGLAVTRSLGRLGIAVYAVDTDPWAPSFDSKYCRGKFVWDFDRVPEEDSVEYLLGIGRELGRRAILLPTSDSTCLFVAANAGALRQEFLFPDLSSHLAHSLHSKKQMYFLARSMGIPTPKTFFPASEREALNFAEEAGFPIIMKTIEYRPPKNAQNRNKAIVVGKKELLDQYRIMEEPERPNVLCQEYIPGGDDASWMFNGYFDEHSRCLFGLTGRKIRQFHAYAGVTSLGVCMPNESVAETTMEFMKAIGYQGILDIGYRYDSRDGLYKVFDINPRIGSTFRLFVSDNGMDVARALYLNLTGQCVVAGHGLPGRKWMVEDLDLASSLRYWRDGKLTAGGWIRSYRGLQESAFFAPDDLRPVISRCLNNLRLLLRPSQKGPSTASSHSRSFGSESSDSVRLIPTRNRSVRGRSL